MALFFPTLYGNASLKARMQERLAQHTVSHAYLIQGDPGTGKHLFAHLLAAALCCEKRDCENASVPCGECNACYKILSVGTPDLMEIERGENASVGIEAIRAIKADMFLAPAELEKKIYIIEDADYLTPAAQNALLVALEEPPRNVHIFLLCHDASSLLPTVRSRVQMLTMSHLTDAEMQTALQQVPAARLLQNAKPEEYRAVLTLAGGSLGLALRLLDDKTRNAIEEIRRHCTNILSCVGSRVPYSRLYQAVAALPTKRKELTSELSYLLSAIRDLTLLKRDENVQLCYFDERESAIQTAAAYSLRCLFAIYDATEQVIKQVDQNANIGVSLTVFTELLHRAPTK